jgi:hypothetical protein
MTVPEVAAASANLLTKLIEFPIQLIAERPIKLRELELSEKLERNQRQEYIRKHALESQLIDNEKEKYWKEQRKREKEAHERQLEQFKNQFLDLPDNYKNDRAKFDVTQIFMTEVHKALESLNLYEKQAKYTDQPDVRKEIGPDGAPPTEYNDIADSEARQQESDRVNAVDKLQILSPHPLKDFMPPRTVATKGLRDTPNAPSQRNDVALIGLTSLIGIFASAITWGVFFWESKRKNSSKINERRVHSRDFRVTSLVQ